MRRLWTDSEIEILRALYPDHTAKEINEVLGRSMSSIYGKADLLNISKSEQFNHSVLSGRLSRVTHNLAPTQFKKGHKPFNKGKSLSEFMSEEGIEKISRAWFTKGHLPHNTSSDGEIRIRCDKNNTTYKYIRISLGVWKALHVYNWEKVNGPVPEGFIVVFKSSDRMNCDISNLELITRGENMLRNTIHRYPEELKSTMRILRKLTHQINGKE
jgi:hypothetical protein